MVEEGAPERAVALGVCVRTVLGYVGGDEETDTDGTCSQPCEGNTTPATLFESLNSVLLHGILSTNSRLRIFVAVHPELADGFDIILPISILERANVKRTANSIQRFVRW